MDISVRSCTDSRVDREFFAWTLNEASRGLVARILGEDSISIVAKASLISDQDVSYQNVDMAEVDGILVGAISHFASELSSSPEAAILQTLESAATEQAGSSLAIARAMALGRLFQANRRYGAKEWHIQSVAVLADYRHLGVASRLILRAESAARENASIALTLDVSDANDEAIALYEQLGFVEEFRTSGKALAGFEGSIRMRKNFHPPRFEN